MPAVLDKLLTRLDASPGFAALDSSGQTACRLIDEDGESNEIVAAILHDPAMTSKLLQLSNSSQHLRGERNVSTIDQVLAILGMDAVKSAIMSLDRIDASICKPRQIKLLHAEIIVSIFTGSLAAGIARTNGTIDSIQEARICGLLQNLGRIMSLFYIYEEIERCHDVQVERNLVESEAIMQALGTGFEELGAAIARHWQLPDVLQNSLAPDNAKSPPQPASSSMVWNRLCALFCRRIAEILFRIPESRERTEIIKCVNYFQKALQLNEKDVAALVNKCLLEVGASLDEMDLSCNVEEARNLLRKASERAWDMLLSQDNLVRKRIGNQGRAPIDSIKHILRLMHDHCNFDCTLICLPTGLSGLVAIAGVGRNAGKLATKFRISGLKHDIFRDIAASKNDTFVADVNSPEHSDLLPAWYHDAANASAFVMLPLMSGERLLGMIYGDYSKPGSHAPGGLAEDEMLGWRNRLVYELEAGAEDFAPEPHYPYLVLQHLGDKLVMDERLPYVRIGRGGRSDIVMQDIRTSRKHAKIKRENGEYVFTDLSSNGSYIIIVGEEETRVQRGELVLHGSGSICLGYPHGTEGAETIQFYFQQ